MSQEERTELLCRMAQKDYEEYMSDVSCMDGPDVVKEAMKIAVMGEMLSQIKTGQFSHPFDVELLLCHAHPLAAAYELWEQSGIGITMAVNEAVNEFLVQTRNTIEQMDQQFDRLPPFEQAMLIDYHNRNLAAHDAIRNQTIDEARDSDDELDR